MVILNHISCQNEATAVCFSTWNRNAEYTKKLFLLLKIDHNSITFLLPLQWNNSAPNMIEHVFMFLELIITYHCIKNVFQFKAESVSTIRIYLPSDGHLSYINKQRNFIRRIGLLHYTYNNVEKVFLLLLIITKCLHIYITGHHNVTC